VRFCSRCGFQLDGVNALLARGGMLMSPADNSPGRTLTPRQRGIRQGAMLMLSTLLVMPVVIFLLVSALGFPGEFIPLIGSICIMGGLLRMLYAIFFEDNFIRQSPDIAPSYIPPASLGANPRGSSLPPAQNAPVGDWRRPNTSELVRPPSVTENTTRLLNNDSEHRER
jgi:hypothetical protein